MASKDVNQSKAAQDELESLTNRLEGHLSSWVDHIDNKLIPELQEVSKQIEKDSIKTQRISDHIDDYNNQFKEYADRSATIAAQKRLIEADSMNYQERFTNYCENRTEIIKR